MESSNSLPGTERPSHLTLQQLVSVLGTFNAEEDDSELQIINLQVDDILFTQGDIGESMYVLIAGILSVRVRREDGRESEIDRLDPGAVVGEMALMSGQRRSASIYALTTARLYRLSRDAYQKLIATDPAAKASLEEGFDPRWQRIQLSLILSQLLGDIEPDALQNVQEELDWQHFDDGEVVERKSDNVNDLYVLINGRVQVKLTTMGSIERVIADLVPGESISQNALLTGEAESITLLTVGETDIVRIPAKTFEKLVQANLEEQMDENSEITTPKFQSQEEVAAALKKNRDLSNADMSNLDLSGMKLKAMNMADANLSGATLVKTSFAALNMENVNLSQANLTGASIAAANLENADMSGANLTGSRWMGVNVSGADFSGADMTDARGGAVDWSSAKVPPEETPEQQKPPAWIPVLILGAMALVVGVLLMRKRQSV